MRTIPIYSLSCVPTLSVIGCYGSRERGDTIDSGFDGTDVTTEASEAGRRDAPKAGAGGTSSVDGTDGTGGLDRDDDTRMDDTPSKPNCPGLNWITIPGGSFTMDCAEGVGRD